MGAPRPLLSSACLACLLLCTACLAAASENPAKHKRWRPEEFPNPQKDLLKCGRRDGVKSSLCDPENILTPQQHNMVDGLVNEIASGAAPFKTAACGDAGQQGFQVRQAVRMHTHVHACQALQHKHTMAKAPLWSKACRRGSKHSVDTLEGGPRAQHAVCMCAP